jgi:transketolase
MVGLAAGLSKEGFKPFLYSIVPFCTFRCIEQIRVDLCYNNLFAVIVGAGGGLSYGFDGPTHLGIDDIGAMSALPNMTILSPCDPFEIKSLLPQVIKLHSPVYLRLARNNDPDCHKGTARSAKIYDPSVIRNGRDAVIFSYGAIVSDILCVLDELEKEGLGAVKLLSCHTIKPIKEGKIVNCLKGDTPVIVIEEHFSSGGLGSCIALILKRNSIKNRFFHLHLPDKYPNMCGDRMYLLERSKLSRAHIKKFLSGLLKHRKD